MKKVIGIVALGAAIFTGGVLSGRYLAPVEAGAPIDAALGLGRMRKYERIKEIADAVAVQDIASVLPRLEAPAYAQVRAMFVAFLLPRYAKADLPAAMAYANGIRATNERHQAVTAVLRGWAEVDSASAADWVRKLPAGPLRERSVSVVAGAMADTDPQAARRWLASSDLPEERKRRLLGGAGGQAVDWPPR